MMTSSKKYIINEQSPRVGNLEGSHFIHERGYTYGKKIIHKRKVREQGVGLSPLHLYYNIKTLKSQELSQIFLSKFDFVQIKKWLPTKQSGARDQTEMEVKQLSISNHSLHYYYNTKNNKCQEQYRNNLLYCA